MVRVSESSFSIFFSMYLVTSCWKSYYQLIRYLGLALSMRLMRFLLMSEMLLMALGKSKFSLAIIAFS